MNGRTDRIREACWYADRLLLGRQYRAVLALCSRTLGEEGDDPSLYLRRARALLATHRDGEAALDVERARALAPASIDAVVLLAEIALRRSDLKQADHLLQIALRRSPAHPRAAELRRVVSGWYRAAYKIAASRRVAPLPPPAPAPAPAPAPLARAA
jgi:tetratricopeptide (TPR) repeat protein